MTTVINSLTSAILDLSTLDWTLQGWRPNGWRLGHSMETGWGLAPEIGPLAAHVPASVQAILRDAGVIEDWNIGLNSRHAEWVEHRHWEWSTAFDRPAAETIYLQAESLEYSGWLIINGRVVAEFSGARTPHSFDISEHLQSGENRLSLIFDTPPPDQGQYGYTSQSRYFASRWAYSWDWCPRIVPIGIGGNLQLISSSAFAIEMQVRTRWNVESARGGLDVGVVWHEAQLSQVQSVRLELADGEVPVFEQSFSPNPGENNISLNDLPVEAWWPNNRGAQKLYTLRIQATDAAGRVLWSDEKSVGFKHVEWRVGAGAPADAEPWICVVNGEEVFLQGVNWTPVCAPHLDATREDYNTLLDLYRDMGANCLRVWGGAGLETADFYAGCDQRGLLVWQEFPLSSSGIDNWPPEDAAAIAELERIVESYIARRGHHVSLLQWCGGNELQGGPNGEKDGVGRPCDRSHPALAALERVVGRDDPGRRFLPTSASGPRFTADAAEFGLGLHHDVHGPWGITASEEEWRRYWHDDDSLFRSETGCAAAASLETLQHFSSPAELWPPATPYWEHAAAWWRQWDRLKSELEELPDEMALQEYIQRTQREQAEFLSCAASECKARFRGERLPRCGGFLIWMGHDCFACPANTSIIDNERNPKPAYFALREVFINDSRFDSSTNAGC